MAKTNTEKPMGKAQEKKQNNVAKATKQNKEMNKTPVKKKEKKIEKVEEKKEIKKPKVKKIKKERTSVLGEDLPLSPKVSAAICKFIRGKDLEKAIGEIEEVTQMKRAIPMKGEYAHRKGKMMSGKYPVKAAKEFLILLKSLQSNANNHDVEKPFISEAVANKGTTVYASGGRTKKRAHIRIVCKTKKEKKLKK